MNFHISLSDRWKSNMERYDSVRNLRFIHCTWHFYFHKIKTFSLCFWRFIGSVWWLKMSLVRLSCYFFFVATSQGFSVFSSCSSLKCAPYSQLFIQRKRRLSLNSNFYSFSFSIHATHKSGSSVNFFQYSTSAQKVKNMRDKRNGNSSFLALSGGDVREAF